MRCDKSGVIHLDVRGRPTGRVVVAVNEVVDAGILDILEAGIELIKTRHSLRPSRVPG